MTLAPPDKSGARAEPPGPDPDAADLLVRPVVRRRESLRRRKRVRRAMVLQSVATVLFVALLAGLVWVGWSSTMRITGGRLDAVTDPDAPGYVAAVRPTSVTLVAFTNPAGDVAAAPGEGEPTSEQPLEAEPEPDPAGDTGDTAAPPDPVAPSATEADDTGGRGGPEDDATLSALLMVIEGGDSTSVVPISADILLWDFEGSTADSARNIFAGGGADVLRLRLGADLTFGATSLLTVPLTLVDELVAQRGEVTVTLPDDVLELAEDGTSAVRYPAGPLTLGAGDAADFLDRGGFNEQELNRTLRTELFWAELLDGSQPLPEGLLLSGQDVDEDVATFVELLDTIRSKPVVFDLLPLQPLPVDGDPPVVLYRIDPEGMPSWVSTHVSFPVSAYPGQRARVRLLNGTTDPAAPAAVAPAVVGAGGEVVQTGNAEAFDLPTSRVAYASPEASAAAARIADALGLTARVAEDLPADVDVEVVVGADRAT